MIQALFSWCLCPVGQLVLGSSRYAGSSLRALRVDFSSLQFYSFPGHTAHWFSKSATLEAHLSCTGPRGWVPGMELRYPAPQGLRSIALWPFPFVHCCGWGVVLFPWGETLSLSLIPLWLPLWLSWFHLQCGRPGFNPWFGKILWRRERLPIPVFWSGKFHGLYSPWGNKELDSTEWLSLFTLS